MLCLMGRHSTRIMRSDVNAVMCCVVLFELIACALHDPIINWLSVDEWVHARGNCCVQLWLSHWQLGFLVAYLHSLSD